MTMLSLSARVRPRGGLSSARLITRLVALMRECYDSASMGNAAMSKSFRSARDEADGWLPGPPRSVTAFTPRGILLRSCAPKVKEAVSCYFERPAVSRKIIRLHFGAG